MKTWKQLIPFLCNDEQEIVSTGYSDLRLHCVPGGSKESPDVQMPLDPFEKQLNLPAFTIQLLNSQRGFNREVDGQKAIAFSGHKSSHTTILNVSGYLRVMAGKSDNLVRKNARAFVDRSVLNHSIGHIVLGAYGKAGAHCACKLNPVDVIHSN